MILLLIPAMLLLLVTLAGLIRLVEWAFPVFSRWLDRNVGEEPGRGRW